MGLINKLNIANRGSVKLKTDSRNMQIIGILLEEKNKELFKLIMVDNFPVLITDAKLHQDELSQYQPGKVCVHAHTPQRITYSQKDNIKRGKNHPICRHKWIITTVELSS